MLPNMEATLQVLHLTYESITFFFVKEHVSNSTHTHSILTKHIKLKYLNILKYVLEINSTYNTSYLNFWERISLEYHFFGLFIK